MPTARSLVAALTLAFTAISCSDKGPTDVNTEGQPTAGQPTDPDFARQKSDLLKNRAVTGTLADGRAVSGTITVTKFNYTEAGGLTVDGVLNYTVTATGQSGTQHFTNAPATLARQGSPTAPVCDILILDIGAISLDLLGLLVDIAPISIDVRAQTGPGNLLGNLLCALVGILDGPGPLAGILALLDRINAILAGL